MFTAASTSTSTPLAISSRRSSGSCSCSAARLLRRGLNTWAATTSELEQESGDVDVVHAGVDDDAVGSDAGRNRGIAVRRVEHQRGTDVTAIQGFLHCPVPVVVAAHEPDHDQPAASGHLGVQDPFAGLPGGRQRLLAEHLLARRDTGQHVLLMGRSPGGNDDRVNPGIGDEVLPGLMHLHSGQPLDRGLRPIQIHVGDRGDPRPRQHIGESADVVLPDHPGADDADVHSHVNSLS